MSGNWISSFVVAIGKVFDRRSRISEEEVDGKRAELLHAVIEFLHSEGSEQGRTKIKEDFETQLALFNDK